MKRSLLSEPMEPWHPAAEGPGPAYHMAERQMYHRPFYRRSDVLTLFVALAPMLLLDMGHYDLFLPAILLLPLVAVGITFLWSIFAARKLLLGGTLYHLTLTPLPLSLVLRDFEKHYRLTGMQSMTLLLAGWTIVAPLFAYFVYWREEFIFIAIPVYIYMFAVRQLLCPAAASLGFRLSLGGEMNVGVNLTPHAIFLACLALPLLFFNYAFTGWMPLPFYFGQIIGVGYLLLIFHVAVTTGGWLKKFQTTRPRVPFEERVKQRIGGLSYS